MIRYAPLPADACLSVPLGPMTACYLRRSGETHLLADPAPQILAALAEGPADAALLTARLSTRYELAMDDAPGGGDRGSQLTDMVETALRELAALGLATPLDGPAD